MNGISNLETPYSVKTAVFNLRTVAMSDDERFLNLFHKVEKEIPELLKDPPKEATLDLVEKYNKLVFSSDIDDEYKNKLYVSDKNE